MEIVAIITLEIVVVVVTITPRMLLKIVIIIDGYSSNALQTQDT